MGVGDGSGAGHEVVHSECRIGERVPDRDANRGAGGDPDQRARVAGRATVLGEHRHHEAGALGAVREPAAEAGFEAKGQDAFGEHTGGDAVVVREDALDRARRNLPGCHG
jgi:hypothetical protein